MIFEQFNFLYPQWFFALIPLVLILWFSFRSNGNSKAWEKVIDAKLLPLLLQGEDNKTGKLAKTLLILGWLITVIALADPVWEKISRPIFQTNTARVIVLDLSSSMLISDLKPSRLARARFKIEDILSRDEEGQTGLVLFAGDAFTASPLTRDTKTIRSLLKILTPQLMPAQGSRVDLGLNKAHELLKQAGVNKGQVLLIADGLSDKNLADKAAKSLVKDGYTVSVLGVGTEEGGTLKFRNYSNVIIKLESDNLSAVAATGKGNYHQISANNLDLQHVLSVKLDGKVSNNKNPQKQNIENDQWKSTGPILILFLIPLAAFAFRRGWLFNVFFAFILVSLLLQTQPVVAFSLDDLWKNKEQQADAALKLQQYDKASKLSNNPLRLGSAAYKLENYAEALKHFKESKGANARYNEGNTLAKLKKYKEAITAYDGAIEQQTDMQDAIENRSAIEKLLEQQHKESDKSEGSDKKNQDNQKNESGQQFDDKSDKKSEKQQGSKDQKSKSSESNQANKEEQDDNKEKSEKINKKRDQEKQTGNQFSDANKERNKKKEDQDSEPSTNDKNSKTKTEQEKSSDTNSDKKEKEQNKLENNESDESVPRPSKVAETELTKEEKMAAEQWLRRIPDDPGGLLRRKFKYQYNRRRNNSSTEKPW
ncbi:MAG: VWA domain-containing protein [Cocleimonas sp.]